MLKIYCVFPKYCPAFWFLKRKVKFVIVAIHLLEIPCPQKTEACSAFVLTHQQWHTQITSFKLPQSHAQLPATQIVEQTQNKTALFHLGAR